MPPAAIALRAAVDGTLEARVDDRYGRPAMVVRSVSDRRAGALGSADGDTIALAARTARRSGCRSCSSWPPAGPTSTRGSRRWSGGAGPPRSWWPAPGSSRSSPPDRPRVWVRRPLLRLADLVVMTASSYAYVSGPASSGRSPALASPPRPWAGSPPTSARAGAPPASSRPTTMSTTPSPICWPICPTALTTSRRAGPPTTRSTARRPRAGLHTCRRIGGLRRAAGDPHGHRRRAGPWRSASCGRPTSSPASPPSTAARWASVANRRGRWPGPSTSTAAQGRPLRAVLRRLQPAAGDDGRHRRASTRARTWSGGG